MEYILQHLFKKSSLEEVPLNAIQELVREHPYFSTAQLLLTKKLQQQQDAGFEKQLHKTALHFNNPLWLQHILESKDEITYPVKAAEKIEEKTIEDELTFTPYHTIDYFASQGIKISQEVKADDKLGQQLKSFTEWLKSMRRLPEISTETTDEATTTEKDTYIEKIAAHSLEEKEVVTEAMAEVLVMQGKKDKAAAVYEKLSFLNPGKRAYFAAKISALKAY